MQAKKIVIHSNQIVNQQRFPSRKFGWPLKEAADVILAKQPNWRSDAEEKISTFTHVRESMCSLADLYGVPELEKWPICSVFIPWFSNKPIVNKDMIDHDFTASRTPPQKIVDKLASLVTSIQTYGFLEYPLTEQNIIVYPMSDNFLHYYVRAGNHRVAALAALGMDIPCFVDDLSYLKKRARRMISARKLFFGPLAPVCDYPNIKSVKLWPAVESKTISATSAEKIVKMFTI